LDLTRRLFGTYQEREIDLFTFSNNNGLIVSLTNFGATITSIRTLDRAGKLGNIVLGYDSLEEYVKNSAYTGSVVGRYANRIGAGLLRIDGRSYQLSCNEKGNHLHGGGSGFDKKVWEASPIREERGCGLALSLISPDGDEGYPGTVDVRAIYLLTPDNRLIIEYSAASDSPTIINLTQHSYFNLAGSGTIHDHHLRINASGYTPVDDCLIPTGVLKSVDDTIFDFRLERRLGSVMDKDNEAQLINGGFDHNFVLDGSHSLKVPAASLYDPSSGRTLNVHTTQPGLQLYTGNHLNERMIGKGGVPFRAFGALCLETQHFPDSPNHRAFPSVLLYPGNVYRQTTEYRFGLRPRRT